MGHQKKLVSETRRGGAGNPIIHEVLIRLAFLPRKGSNEVVHVQI